MTTKATAGLLLEPGGRPGTENPTHLEQPVNHTDPTADARQPAYDAVFAYIRQQPRDFLPTTVVDRNAMIWRAVNAALDAVVAPPTSRAAEAELYVLLRKAGEDRHEAQALIDRHRDEVLRRLAAEAQQQCPGIETVPNRCTCDCEGCKHHCGAHNPTDPPHVRAARYAAAGNEMAASLVRDGFGDDEITEILARPATEQPTPSDTNAPRP